jgi:hypothetical protein
MEKYNTVSPAQESRNNFVTCEMPQPVYHPQQPQQPYPNAHPTIQRAQQYPAKLAAPPSDYLVWSIVNTVCSVLFSCWP